MSNPVQSFEYGHGKVHVALRWLDNTPRDRTELLKAGLAAIEHELALVKTVDEHMVDDGSAGGPTSDEE
jgi:hypothetical protein